MKLGSVNAEKFDTLRLFWELLWMTNSDFELLEAQMVPIRLKMEKQRVLTKREHQIARQYNAALDKMADGGGDRADNELDVNFGVAPQVVPPGDFSEGIQGVHDELGFVEPPHTLTQAERKFILAYSQAIPTREAFEGAFKTKKKVSNDKMWACIRGIFEKEEARTYLEELNARVESVAIASKAKIEMFLTAAMEATLQTVGTDSPLCRKAVVTRSYNKEGDVIGQRLERQLVDPLKAIEILSRMRGYDQPQKVQVEHRGGVMVVPMTANDEEWLAIAEKQQQKLIEETIDV